MHLAVVTLVVVEISDGVSVNKAHELTEFRRLGRFQCVIASGRQLIALNRCLVRTSLPIPNDNPVVLGTRRRQGMAKEFKARHHRAERPAKTEFSLCDINLGMLRAILVVD